MNARLFFTYAEIFTFQESEWELDDRGIQMEVFLFLPFDLVFVQLVLLEKPPILFLQFVDRNFELFVDF